MTREWFTIAELAGLNLPDLPPSERQLARAAKAWKPMPASAPAGAAGWNITSMPCQPPHG